MRYLVYDARYYRTYVCALITNDTENDHLIIPPSRHMCPNCRNWISISGKRTAKFSILIRLFVSLILLSNSLELLSVD